jgi:hypothetical protein
VRRGGATCRGNDRDHLQSLAPLLARGGAIGGAAWTTTMLGRDDDGAGVVGGEAPSFGDGAAPAAAAAAAALPLGGDGGGAAGGAPPAERPPPLNLAQNFWKCNHEGGHLEFANRTRVLSQYSFGIAKVALSEVPLSRWHASYAQDRLPFHNTSTVWSSRWRVAQSSRRLPFHNDTYRRRDGTARHIGSSRPFHHDIIRAGRMGRTRVAKEHARWVRAGRPPPSAQLCGVPTAEIDVVVTLYDEVAKSPQPARNQK